METQVKKISPRRTRAYAAATTLAVVLVAAACGGDNNADPPATSAAVPNTAPSTILPPTTDPAPTTTAPAPTTTPTVPTPPTTTEPSEEEQAKQAVIEAAENAWYVFNEAKLDPADTLRTSAAIDAYTSDAQAWVRDYLEEQRASNRRSVTFEPAPAAITVYPDSVQLDLASGTATVDVCDLNSNTTVEIGGNPDGTDRVLDDSVTAYLARNTFQLVDENWLFASTIDLETYEGALSCDAAP